MPTSTFTIPKTGGVTTPATSFDITPPASTSNTLDFSSIFGVQAPVQGPVAPTVTAAKASQTDTTAKANTLASTTNTSSATTKNVVASSDTAVANENSIKSDVSKLMGTIITEPGTGRMYNSVTGQTTGYDASKNTSGKGPGSSTSTPTSSSSTSIFDEYARQLAIRRETETKAINAAFDETKRQTEISQNKETESTKVGLTRIGGYLGGSASSIGALNNLAETHRLDLSALESKRVSAIQSAQNAIDDQQFKVAQAKSQEAKDLAKQIDDRNQQFFDNALKLTQESRLQSNQDFSQSLDVVDRIAPTIYTTIQSMSESDAAKFLNQAATTLKIDPNLLMGKVNALGIDLSEKTRTAVTQLAAKYPSANITDTDPLQVATDKVRNSSEYKLDIAKSEADLANVNSLISDRAQTNASVDYSSPILKLYTEGTGEVVSSASSARAITGYAESILSGKEIVADDFTGPLLDNQIKASDAKKQIVDAFVNLNKKKGAGEVPDSTVWQWLGTPEGQGTSDEDKKKFIMQAGKNPSDYGIY
jgi:hypothetical protein